MPDFAAQKAGIKITLDMAQDASGVDEEGPNRIGNHGAIHVA